MIAEETKIQHSRFVRQYEGRLVAWGKELTQRPGTIVGIARKGPRLLELMVQEGVAAPSLLDRVVTEFALPLMGESIRDVTVIDDSVIHGSTFSYLVKAARLLQSTRVSGVTSVKGIPLAAGARVGSDFAPEISKSFVSLSDDAISPFVNSEIGAFRMLGKPYDVEHPFVTFAGEELAELGGRSVLLAELAEQLGADVVEIPSSVVTMDGIVQAPRYSLLLRDHRNAGSGPEFRKIRVLAGRGARMC